MLPALTAEHPFCILTFAICILHYAFRRARHVRGPRWAWLAMALLLTAASGCTRPPPTVKVVGRVTLNGEPLAKAHIVFVNAHPDDQPAFGLTDADGRYALRTYVSPSETLEGAYPRDYRVIVYKFTKPFTERLDAAIAERFADPVPGILEPIDPNNPPAVGTYQLSAGFRPPSAGMNIESVREMLSLTDDQLRRLSDHEIKQLRAPPDWVMLSWSEEANRLSDERATGKSLVPLNYCYPDKTPFTAVVERSEVEPLVFDFDLTGELPTYPAWRPPALAEPSAQISQE